jgi:hypothetical protein
MMTYIVSVHIQIDQCFEVYRTYGAGWGSIANLDSRKARKCSREGSESKEPLHIE